MAYAWSVLPEHESDFADVTDALFGDAQPTPFGQLRSEPQPTAEPATAE
ncbi:MAG: hypothetical protein WD904_08575 [Dehalococcoidia bacterium]